MAKTKAGQPVVRIGRRTGENVIPANKVFGEASNGMEDYANYWSDQDDSDDSDDDTINSPVKNKSSINDTRSKLGRRTGVEALSGKHIKTTEDGSEDYKCYWTEQESATDASFLTRPSSLTDASKQTRRSSAIEASGRTHRSSTKRGDAYFIDPNTSGLPEKTVPKLGRRTGVKDLSGKHIKTTEDGSEDYKCYWTEGESVSDASFLTRPSSLADASKQTRPSSAIEASDRTHRSSTKRSDAYLIDPNTSGLWVEKTVHDKSCNTSDTIKDKSRFTTHTATQASQSLVSPNKGTDHTSPGPLQKRIGRSSRSESQQTPDKSVRKDNSDNEEEIASTSILSKNTTFKPRHLTYSLRSSPRKGMGRSESQQTPDKSVRKDNSDNEEEIASTSILSKNTTFIPRHLTYSLRSSPRKGSPKKITNTLESPQKNENHATNDENATYKPNLSSNEILPEGINNSAPSLHRKSSLRNTSTPTKNKRLTFAKYDNTDESEIPPNDIKNKNPTSNETSKTSLIYSLRMSPRKSPRKNVPNSSITGDDTHLESENSASEDVSGMTSPTVNNKNAPDTPLRVSSGLSPNKVKSPTHSVRSSPRKSSQQRNIETSVLVRNKNKLISEDSDDEKENGAISSDANIKNTSGRPPHVSREMSPNKIKNLAHSPKKSSQQKTFKSSIPIRKERFISKNSAMKENFMKNSEVISPSVNNKNATDLPLHASTKTLPNRETRFNDSPRKSSLRNASSSFKTKSITKNVMSDKSESERELDNLEMNEIPSTDIRDEYASNRTCHASVEYSPSKVNLIQSLRSSPREKNIPNSTKSKMSQISEESESEDDNVKKVSKQRNIKLKIITKKKNKLVVETSDEEEYVNMIGSESAINYGSKKELDKNPQGLKKKDISSKNKQRIRRQNRVIESSSSDSEFDKENQMASTSKKMPYESSKSNSLKKRNNLSNSSIRSSPKETIPNRSRSTRKNNPASGENVSDDMVEEEIISTKTKKKTINRNPNKFSKNLGPVLSRFSGHKSVNDATADDQSTFPEDEKRKESVDDNPYNSSNKTSHKILKNTSLPRSSKKNKFTEESDIDEDEMSIMKEAGSMAQSNSQFSSKKHSKAQKTTDSKSPKKKRRLQVEENIEDDPGGLEQEFESHDSESDVNIPRGIESANNSSKISKKTSRRRSANRSLKKNKLVEDLESDSEIDKAGISFVSKGGNKAPDKSKLTSKKHSKAQKTTDSKSSKKKRRLQVEENIEDDPEGLEQEFEAHDLESDVNIPIGIEGADNSRKISIKTSRRQSVTRSLKKNKLVEDLESDFDEAGISHLSKSGSMAPGSSHLSSKKHSKAKNTTQSKSTSKKREPQVEENVLDNPEGLEQEFEAHDFESDVNIQRGELSVDKSRNTSKRNNRSLQRSSRKKSRLESDPDNDSDSISTGDISHARHGTIGSDANSSLHITNKPKPKDKQLNSSKSKRKIHLVEDEESNPENLELEFEADDKEQETHPPKTKKSKTKPKKARQEIPPEELRRSNRNRVAPLKHWANERRLYQFVYKTNEIKYLGYDPGTGEDEDWYLKKMEKKQQQAKVEQKKKTSKRNSKTAVCNNYTGKEERVILHRLFEFVEWESPHGNEGDDRPAGYSLTKPFNTSNLTFGFLNICAKEMKPSQVSPNGSIYFLVVKGMVKTTIHGTEREFKKLDSFIVPKHQTYSIENLTNSNALLSFCAFKVPFFDYET